jgi:hypothetical protein
MMVVVVFESENGFGVGDEQRKHHAGCLLLLGYPYVEDNAFYLMVSWV